MTPGDLASTPCLDASPISISEATSDLEPTLAQDLELSSDPHNGEDMLSYTSGIPGISPTNNQSMNSEELSH